MAGVVVHHVYELTVGLGARVNEADDISSLGSVDLEVTFSGSVVERVSYIFKTDKRGERRDFCFVRMVLLLTMNCAATRITCFCLPLNNLELERKNYLKELRNLRQFRCTPQ